MKGATIVTALLTVLAVMPVPGDGQELQLRSGYVLCEAPGQLSFFMEPNVFDFMDREPPDSVRVYPDGHPDKKGKLMVDGRFRTVTKGRKALERGWCQNTGGRARNGHVRRRVWIASSRDSERRMSEGADLGLHMAHVRGRDPRV